MSRGRDDERTLERSGLDRLERGLERPDRGRPDLDRPDRDRVDRGRDRRPDRAVEMPIDRLLLPRGEDREIVTGDRGHEHRIRGSETRVLATVGAFLAVAEDDLAYGRSPADRNRLTADLKHLANEHLVERRTIPINYETRDVVFLTREGQALLDAHRHPAPDGRDQQFNASLAGRRDLPHDAQLYRLFQAEAAAIEARGGRIERVVLEYEFKSDFQIHLHRPDRPTGPNADEDRAADGVAFAHARELPVENGHVLLPDLRIEYELDGRLEHRDLELITEHYSRSMVAAKGRAGFSLYRAVGRSGRATRGSPPLDPHHLRKLV